MEKKSRRKTLKVTFLFIFFSVLYDTKIKTILATVIAQEYKLDFD
jgi:hypothetical protein